MARSFFPGKRNSGHIGGGNPPSNRIPNTSDGTVQAKGQFGRPSGKTVASPLSRLNGVVAGRGSKKGSTEIPGGTKPGGYGRVRVR